MRGGGGGGGKGSGSLSSRWLSPHSPPVTHPPTHLPTHPPTPLLHARWWSASWRPSPQSWPPPWRASSCCGRSSTCRSWGLWCGWRGGASPAAWRRASPPATSLRSRAAARWQRCGRGGGGGGGGLACVPARMQPNPQSPLAHTHNRSPLPATPTRARQEGLGAHYRCPATHQLNERFGDLLPRIQASGCGGEGGTRGRAIAHPLHPANC